MSDGEAAWSGWGAPPPRPQAPVAPFDVNDADSRDHARVQAATPSAMSKNRIRRQRRGIVGHDPIDHATCRPAAHTPLSDRTSNDPLYRNHDHEHGRCSESAADDCRGNRHAHAEEIDGALCPLASPTCARVFGAIDDMIRSPPDLGDDQHAAGLLDDNQVTGADSDDRRDLSKNSTDEHQRVGSGKNTVQHQRAFDNNAQDDRSDDVAASDTNDDDSDDMENNKSDKGRPGQGHNYDARGGHARTASSGGAVAIARGPHKNHPRCRRTEASGGALTRISVKSRPDDCSPLPSIIVEGDVLSCRTCGLSSTARRSSRMGVYVGDGWVVHAVQRRQRGAPSHGDAYYEVVQQTLQDFAQGKTLSADEWFRTRSEFPAAVRVRRALERVGAEWEVPDGLDNARVSEDFALWVATGQSALTHADYRDDRDEGGPSTTAPSVYRSSFSSRKKRNRRDSDERGVVARAVRVGSDSPPPVLARIHQPAMGSSLSATPLAAREVARPAPVANDYRHAVAGGIVGLYLGGPIGGAVGGAAGLLLDSMASLGRGWRS